MGRSGYTCVRRVFCWLNILLWLTGGAALAAGAWLRWRGAIWADGAAKHSGPATLLPQHAGAAADVPLMAVGVLTLTVAFFGCCGAWFQNKCMLVTYFSLVIVLFLSEFLVGSLAFVYRHDIGARLASELRDSIRDHYNTTSDLADVWDKIHTEFQCCGVTTYEDWYDISAWPGERWVPASCCMPLPEPVLGPSLSDRTTATSAHSQNQQQHHCGQTHNPVLWYGQGCAEGLRLWLVKRLHVVGVVGLLIAFVQLFGLISSMLLFCTVRHKRSAHSYKSYSPHA